VSPKKLSPRAERRAQAREEAKLAKTKEALARLEAGGAPARPVVVESASQIDVHARAVRCLRCDASVRLDEHTAETFDGVRLRVVRIVCLRCGARRVLYFRIAPALTN
jgi:hypothetical protein